MNPIGQYIISAIRDSNTVELDTTSSEGHYIQATSKAIDDPNYGFESFLESLPLSLRTAISMDVDSFEFSDEYTLSIHIDPDEQLEEAVDLAKVSLEQQYNYVSGLIKDIEYFSNQGSGLSEQVTIPSIKWVDDTMFVVEQDLQLTVPRPDTINQYAGNFEYCTSLAIDVESNTVTYKFENPFGILNPDPEKEQEDLHTQKQRTNVFRSHFLKCPNCSQQSVTAHNVSPEAVLDDTFENIFECVNCNFTTIVKKGPYEQLFRKTDYTTLQGFCQNFLTDSEELQPDEDILFDVEAKTELKSDYTEDKHRFTYNGTEYSVHRGDTSTQLDVYLNNNEDADEKQFILTSIDGTIAHIFAPNNSWSDPRTNSESNYGTDVFCNFCAESTLSSGTTYKVFYKIMPLTKNLYRDETFSKGRINTVEMCESCYTELVSALEFGINKYSHEFLAETI